MTKIDETVAARRNAPQSISYSDVRSVCVHFLDEPRQSGTSHAVFTTPWPGDPRVSIQKSKGGNAKPLPSLLVRRGRQVRRDCRRVPVAFVAARRTRRSASRSRRTRRRGHTQYTSWAFTRRALDSGLVPSMGSIGDCLLSGNGQMESFWARMQVELLNRKRWNTRLELANAIFEYLEILHDRQQRHSSLGMLSPIEYELRHADNPARDRAN